MKETRNLNLTVAARDSAVQVRREACTAISSRDVSLSIDETLHLPREVFPGVPPVLDLAPKPQLSYLTVFHASCHGYL